MPKWKLESKSEVERWGKSRSSLSQMFFKITWAPANLLIKRSKRRCFPVNFAKYTNAFYKHIFLQNTYWLLLEKIIIGKILNRRETKPLYTLVFFYTPLKQKTRGFLMFSGGVEKDEGHKIGKIFVWCKEDLNNKPCHASAMEFFVVAKIGTDFSSVN